MATDSSKESSKAVGHSASTAGAITASESKDNKPSRAESTTSSPLSLKEAQEKFNNSFFGTSVRLSAAHYIHRKKSNSVNLDLKNTLTQLFHIYSARLVHAICKVGSQTPPSQFHER